VAIRRQFYPENKAVCGPEINFLGFFLHPTKDAGKIRIRNERMSTDDHEGRVG